MKNYTKLFFSFSIGTWTKAILSFITTPVITYIIAPQEFGKASIYGVFYSIFLTIVVLGTHQSYVRFFYEYTERDRSKLLWSCLWPSLIVTSIVSLLLLLNWRFLSKVIVSGENIQVILLLIFSLFTGVIQLFNMYSVRMKKMGLRYSLLEIVSYLANFGGTLFYALVFGRDFYAVITGQIIANLVTFSMGVSFELDYWKPKNVSYEMIRKVVRYGIPFVPTFLLTWLFQSIDKVTLRTLSTFSEIGLYAVAFKLANAMNIIQTGFTTFWVPVAYERYETKPDDRSLYVKAHEIIAFGMFALGSTVILGKDVIFLLVSKSYRSASTIAPFLVLGPVMYTISETTVLGINFTKKVHWHFIISLITSASNVVGNFVLVPIYGAKGAAISTGLSYFLFFVLRTHISISLFPTKYSLNRFYFSTALIIVQCLVATFVQNLMINLVLGIIVLLAHLLNYKGVVKSELKPIWINTIRCLRERNLKSV